MTTGVFIKETVSVQSSAPTGSTVVGTIGTGTDGSPTSELGEPTLVHELAEAVEVFGSEGTLSDAARFHFALNTSPFVGVRYDNTLTGPALETALTAAITALGKVEATLGVRPDFLASNGTTFSSRSDTTGDDNATLFKTIAGTLQAKVLADGANDSRANAVTWATVNGGNDLIATPQEATTPVGNMFGSAVLMPSIVNLISRLGIGESISNKPLTHITSATPAYGHHPGTTNDDADALRAAGALLIVRDLQGTWRAWGGDTRYSPADDPRSAYNVDMIVRHAYRRIREIAETAIDASGVLERLDSVVVRINGLLSALQARGDFASFTVAPDNTQNTSVNLAQGRIYLIITLQPTRSVKSITLNVEIS